MNAARYDGGASRYSAVVAATTTTSHSPRETRYSVASRSDTRSWCGEKWSYGSVSQSGQERHAQPGREPRDLLGQALRGQRVGADDRDDALDLRASRAELRERQRIGRAGERSCGSLAARVRNREQQRRQRKLRRVRRRGGRRRQACRARSRTRLYGGETATPSLRFRQESVYLRDGSIVSAIPRRLSLPAADADAAVLGEQLDRRPRAARRHPADGDDVLPLALRDPDPGAVRVAARAPRLAGAARALEDRCWCSAPSASARTTAWPISASTTRPRPTA